MAQTLPPALTMELQVYKMYLFLNLPQVHKERMGLIVGLYCLTIVTYCHWTCPQYLGLLSGAGRNDTRLVRGLLLQKLQLKVGGIAGSEIILDSLGFSNFFPPQGC